MTSQRLDHQARRPRPARDQTRRFSKRWSRARRVGDLGTGSPPTTRGHKDDHVLRRLAELLGQDAQFLRLGGAVEPTVPGGEHQVIRLHQEGRRQM